MTQTTETFHCFEGIWHYPRYTAVQTPLPHSFQDGANVDTL